MSKLCQNWSKLLDLRLKLLLKASKTVKIIESKVKNVVKRIKNGQNDWISDESCC